MASTTMVCGRVVVLAALLAACENESTLFVKDGNDGGDETGEGVGTDTGDSGRQETGLPVGDSDTADTGDSGSTPLDSEGDTGPGDSASGDSAAPDTGGEDTGETDDFLVEICYDPLVTMDSGELYLDGALFTSWDTRPADEAASGDTEMCATVEVVSGEEMKMNAWFVEIDTVTVEWAAYNNWCESIDWQGVLTVDGVEVTPTTTPWSEEEWETSPCDIGGDAFFPIP